MLSFAPPPLVPLIKITFCAVTVRSKGFDRLWGVYWTYCPSLRVSLTCGTHSKKKEKLFLSPLSPSHLHVGPSWPLSHLPPLSLYLTASLSLSLSTPATASYSDTVRCSCQLPEHRSPPSIHPSLFLPPPRPLPLSPLKSATVAIAFVSARPTATPSASTSPGSSYEMPSS